MDEMLEVAAGVVTGVSLLHQVRNKSGARTPEDHGLLLRVRTPEFASPGPLRRPSINPVEGVLE